ncbi:hypothetical protein [Kerstersia similis]|uniref:hypothetical protein n=1 Tax=Kerstersia similis TaxID=206505 RepID=UPI0039F028BC
MQILHIAYFIQLTFFENVADVARDDRTVATEQLGNLILAQSDRFMIQGNVQLNLAVIRLINGKVCLAHF